MKSAVLALLLAFSLIFIFGCAQGDSGAPAPQQVYQAPEIPPALPSIPEPPFQPVVAVNNSSAALQPPVPPANNSSLAEPPSPVPPREPIISVGTLKVGQKMDFEEGYLILDDVWTYSPPSEPALISIYYPNGALNKSVQAFAFSESRFISRNGTRFWIAIGDTQAGYSIYVKRAKFYIFESRDSNDRFDKSLYSDIIGERALLSANMSSLFGKKLAQGVLGSGENISSRYSLVQFDDLGREPAAEMPALVTLNDSASARLEYAKIGVGKAYVYRSSGKLLALHNDGAFLAKNGSRYASLSMYEAAAGAEENRTYSVAPSSYSKPSGYLVDNFALYGFSPTDTGRELKLRLSEKQSATPGADGVVLTILDSDEFYVGEGMVKKTVPLFISDPLGKVYSLWLESVSTGASGTMASATISMYRVA